MITSFKHYVAVASACLLPNVLEIWKHLEYKCTMVKDFLVLSEHCRDVPGCFQTHRINHIYTHTHTHTIMHIWPA